MPVRTASLDNYQKLLASSPALPASSPLPLNCFGVNFKPSLLPVHAATSSTHR